MENRLNDAGDFEIVLPSSPSIKIPAELITALAIGLDEPDDAARLHNVPDKIWGKLKTYSPFLKEVERQRKELEATGFTFRLKAKHMTESVFDDAYKLALMSDTTLMQKLEFIKLGAKLADIEPKLNTNSNVSPFSINITLPSTSTPTATVTPITIESS